MKCHWLNNQHGSVLLFTTVTLVLLLVFGGIAIDINLFRLRPARASAQHGCRRIGRGGKPWLRRYRFPGRARGGAKLRQLEWL